jgi:hypothetical protein
MSDDIVENHCNFETALILLICNHRHLIKIDPVPQAWVERNIMSVSVAKMRFIP